jgi:hypothetical protein
MVLFVALNDSTIEESFRLIICSEMEKLGFYIILFEYVSYFSKGQFNLLYMSITILENLRWILTRQQPSLISIFSSLQLKLQRLLFQTSELEILFSVSRTGTEPTCMQLAIEILVNLLHMSDKHDCMMVQVFYINKLYF